MRGVCDLVDGQLMISYVAHCRVLSRLGPASQLCPKDPRPHIAAVGKRGAGNVETAGWLLCVRSADGHMRRAVVRGKGGHRPEVVCGLRVLARLLPRYPSGRGRGPVFVSHRRLNAAPALVDVSPVAGRGRLSCQQAWNCSAGLRAGRCTCSVTRLSPTWARRGWEFHY